MPFNFIGEKVKKRKKIKITGINSYTRHGRCRPPPNPLALSNILCWYLFIHTQRTNLRADFKNNQTTKQVNNYIWTNRKQVKFCFYLPIGPDKNCFVVWLFLKSAPCIDIWLSTCTGLSMFLFGYPHHTHAHTQWPNLCWYLVIHLYWSIYVTIWISTPHTRTHNGLICVDILFSIHAQRVDIRLIVDIWR